MDIDEHIKNIRRKNGLTQKELAQKTGLSIASIQGYEQGKYKPKIEQLKKIATALNVSIYDLVQFTTGPNCTDRELKIALANDSKSVQRLLEDRIIYAYKKLNSEGQDKAIELVELLTKIPEYQKNFTNPKEDLELLAAHARTDVEQTSEGIQHDLDIMNDDSEWK
ncbi:helix-turn-helix domain-containing protein [Blautia wexlerae]|uniref:helix-turn-helix domain-containing protein n=1 Tax=Blautia wexlerae TaxID=418240 RepID=UPI0018A8BFF1|nr:helix-turn-helix domain-containing protein [Blautia wexlerae]MDB2176080.1 helix-turn-helix domain-containing protein [Blautia wexlerae]MDB6439428.1 helix-turn-helix domain-containing protein [Blautia wexlerae]